MPYNLEFLSDYGRRPFDEVIKRALREPGVTSELFQKYIKADWANQIPQDLVWLDGQLQPKQRTWNTDTIGRLSDGAILHIEQQTSNHADMKIRMMEYACLIATNHNMESPVRQMYFSTGDTKAVGYTSGMIVKSDLGAISNEFIYFDAGDFIADDMLESENFTVASMSLLSKKISDPEKHIKILIDKAFEKFNGERLINQLVSCVFMASLRRNANLFKSLIPMQQRDPVFQDPFFQECANNHFREQAMKNLNKAVKNCKFEIPNDFITWLSRQDNTALIFDIAVDLLVFSNFPELLKAYNIPWDDAVEIMKLERAEILDEFQNRNLAYNPH